MLALEDVKRKLGLAAKHREVVRKETSYLLRKTSPAYNGNFGAENIPLSIDNTIFYDTNFESSEA